MDIMVVKGKMVGYHTTGKGKEKEARERESATSINVLLMIPMARETLMTTEQVPNRKRNFTEMLTLKLAKVGVVRTKQRSKEHCGEIEKDLQGKRNRYIVAVMKDILPLLNAASQLPVRIPLCRSGGILPTSGVIRSTHQQRETTPLPREGEGDQGEEEVIENIMGGGGQNPLVTDRIEAEELKIVIVGVKKGHLERERLPLHETLVMKSQASEEVLEEELQLLQEMAFLTATGRLEVVKDHPSCPTHLVHLSTPLQTPCNNSNSYQRLTITKPEATINLSSHQLSHQGKPLVIGRSKVNIMRSRVVLTLAIPNWWT